MNKYINLRSALDVLTPDALTRNMDSANDDLMRRIARAAKRILAGLPTVNLRENEPGKWLHTDAAPHRVYCSVCYETYLRNEKWAEELPIKLHPNYCPNCGAKMEVDGDE